MSNSQAVINCRKRRKTNLLEVLGGKCIICGFDEFPEALEFHHVNPKQKSFGIGSSHAVTKSLDAQLEEMKKCVLLCSNCHKGVHAQYYTIPSDWEKYYDEEAAQTLRNEKYDVNHNSYRYCEYCGKLFKKSNYDQKYCSPECSHKAQRKTERPSREEFKDMIRTIPFSHIALKYNVSENAIKKWCDEYQLPRKKTDIKNISDEDWINI